jgi:isopenicillin-N N-acyltransferase like protein
MFKLRCNLEWPQVLEVSREFNATLSELAPDLLDEMQGIAEGMDELGVGVLDIIALNCRSEIALGKWTDGCTALGWNVGPQFLSQNWDWHKQMKNNLTLMSIDKPGKPVIWMVTEASQVHPIVSFGLMLLRLASSAR